MNLSEELKVITTTQDLALFCESISKDDFIALDTEFMRENTYYPILCLIQVAGTEHHGLIDPLAKGMDLSPFIEILKNAQIRKVFHAGRQDLEIFYNLMGTLPHNIYDTQIASMVCGFGDSVGYETLVNEILKKTLDKTSRVSDWSIRPLSQKQLKYALLDVVYLRDLYEHLVTRIEESGRSSWISEELNVLSEEKTYVLDLEKYLSKLSFRKSKPEYLARALAILKVREDFARNKNIPRGWILRDDFIVDMALLNPQTLDDFKGIRGLYDRLMQHKIGPTLLEALKNVAPEKLDPNLLKNTARIEKKVNPDLMEVLKLTLKLVARSSQVSEKLIATNRDLEDIIREGENATTACLKGWRHEIFGQKALALLQGHLTLKVSNNTLVLLEAE